MATEKKLKTRQQIRKDFYTAHADDIRKKASAKYHDPDHIPGFQDCEACGTCLKYGCRHNPINKRRAENDPLI